MRDSLLRSPLSLTIAAGLALALVAPIATGQQAPVDRPAAATRQAPPTVGTGPNGATLRCRDGSYPAPKAPDSACDAKGGVLVRFPLRYVTTAAEAVAPAAAKAEPAPAARPTAPPDGFVPFSELRARRDTLSGPPIGATLLCKDGTYIVADTSTARCQSKGGLHLRLGAPRTP